MNMEDQPLSAPERSHRTRNVILGSIGAVILIVVIAVVATGGGNKPPPVSTGYSPPPVATTTPAPQVTDPAGEVCPASEASGGYCPGDSPPPQYTVSQQQAIDAAQSYLNVEPGFSYQGLIDQLDSAYGSGFSVADATFAVSTIAAATDEAFWDQQAAASAKNYMQTEPGWSACSLVQQLDSSAVQFTQAQAEYGSSSVGLGNC
jgi:Host cell surface-exposed lipoprotein